MTRRFHDKASGDPGDARVRAMLEGLPDALLACDVDGRVVYASRLVASLLDADPDALNGRELDDVIDGTPLTGRRTELLGAIGGTAATFDARTPDGRVFRVDACPTGEGLVVHARDVTCVVQSLEERDRYFELSPALLAVVDHRGCFVGVNPAVVRVLGRPAHEMVGVEALSVVHPDDRERTREVFELTMSGGSAYGVETRWIDSEGGIVWLSWNAVGSGRRMYTAARDITQERRARRLEQAQHEILEKVAAGTPLVQVLTDLALLVESHHPGVRCAVMLVDDDGAHLRQVTGPSLPDSWNQAVDHLPITPDLGSCAAAVATGRTVAVRDIAADPRWEPARETALAAGIRACLSVPILGRDREAVGTFAVYFDTPRDPTPAEEHTVEVAVGLATMAVTRSRTDDELRLLRKAVAHLNDIVLILEHEPEPRILFANRAFYRRTGWRRDEVVGRSLDHLFGERTPDDARRRIARGMDDAVPVREEVLWAARDGKEVWLELDVVPMTDERGQRTRRVAIGRDVTERKALEEQFRHSQKMEAVGRLAGGIAHDFNNMLTVILGLSRLAVSDLPADHPIAEDLREITRAAERSTELTRQLLAFSRKQVLQPRVLDVNALVRDMDKMTRRVIGDHVELELALHEVPPVRADAGQLEQVLMNLVLNACDAMPDGGRLVVTTRAVDEPTGPFVSLAVTDTGAGMDEDTRERVFEPFFTTKARGEGTGLGLSTAYGIVEQSGGSIRVESAPGEGSTFTVLLPCCRTETCDEARDTRDDPEPETILLVEDEFLVRRFARRVLERSGYVVLAASDGEEAIRLAESHEGHIDLLLTDVVMPGIGGREAAERIGRMRPDTRVLFMSGHADSLVDDHPGTSIAFVQKPLLPDTLTRKVRDVLDGERG